MVLQVNKPEQVARAEKGDQELVPEDASAAALIAAFQVSHPLSACCALVCLASLPTIRGCRPWLGLSSHKHLQLNVVIAVCLLQYAVGMYAAVARRLLRRYDGYECKEPEPGKFTIAFKYVLAQQWALMSTATNNPSSIHTAGEAS